VSEAPAGNLAEGRTAMAFGTPISSHQWPDSEALNAGLAARILAEEAKADGVLRSNIGGWHSASDLLTWNDPHVAILRDRIRRHASDLVALTTNGSSARFALAIDAWANVSRDGHYNGVHDHPMSHWSGVYYVASGTPAAGNPHNGMLELLDPRSGVNMLPLHGSVFDARCLISPIPGLMVFFPSWLKHLVHPFRGTGERISISWNVKVSAETAAG
jgi:uncharacterized protein (TIGR02466 family)